MYKIGMSSCAFALSEENFIGLNKAGIEAVEISMHPDRLEKLNYKETEVLAARYGVGLWSFHLPFLPYDFVDFSSLNEQLRKKTLERYTEYIKLASDIGVNKFIVHPSNEPIAPDKREERILRSMQSLDELAEIAHRHGAVIAVEDLPRTCLGNTAAEMKRLISANDKLRVCFDTNHLLIDTNENFIKTLGDKIITLHVSDYDFIDERHLLPGEGKVDWCKLFRELKAVNYSGVWMYEVAFSSPAAKGRSRDLTFSDFATNAKSIFAGEAPTKI